MSNDAYDQTVANRAAKAIASLHGRTIQGVAYREFEDDDGAWRAQLILSLDNGRTVTLTTHDAEHYASGFSIEDS